MSSYAHQQLWRHTRHDGGDRIFLAFMEGFTKHERARQRERARRTGKAHNIHPSTEAKIHHAARVLKRHGGMMQCGDLAAIVGMDAGRLNKSLMNAEHLYLFYEENHGGRVYLGLYKEVCNETR